MFTLKKINTNIGSEVPYIPYVCIVDVHLLPSSFSSGFVQLVELLT